MKLAGACGMLRRLRASKISADMQKTYDPTQIEQDLSLIHI